VTRGGFGETMRGNHGLAVVDAGREMVESAFSRESFGVRQGAGEDSPKGAIFFECEIFEEMFDSKPGCWLKMCWFYYWHCSCVGVKQAKQYL